MTPRRLFRTVAIAEAITWALLIAGMIVRSLGITPLGVRIGGGLHGFVFIAFVAVLIFVAGNQRWKPLTILLGLVSSIIPFATVVFDLVAERRGLLDGGWDTDSPAIVGRFRASAVAHPIRAALRALAAVTVIFAVMLIIGPPGSQ
ncbi:DUF3817 domain-containing protein [Naumannella halotolerans]|uniref:DUF3817 domain-containing protein n=1 Tax=Naumannella halotolerans TaxID=993414 RepID=UPI00370DDB15